MKAVIIFLFAFATFSAVSSSCWTDWSRCSQWSSGFGGILWQKCSQRCVCLGFANGVCRDVKNTCSLLPTSTTVGQCRCSGVRTGSKPRWCGF
jgi:hypothetical protein